MREYKMKHSKGFTLVELVVVIVIVGIISALGGMIIANHIQGYADVSRRAELVDSAESALRLMQREVRSAVPNSVRKIPEYEGIVFLHTIAGGRYKDLDFSQEIEEIPMVGELLDNSTEEIDRLSNSSVVIFNTGNPPLDAHLQEEPHNRWPIDDVNASVPRFDLDEPKDFPHPSPFNKFQIFDSQVRYVHEDSELWRYERDDEDITDPESTNNGDWGERALVASNVHEVEFAYDSGSPWRNALLTMELTLKDEGEKISLLHQVHVQNTP